MPCDAVRRPITIGHVLVLIRMALTFVENYELHHSRALALPDELTGLANRRAFHERLRAELRATTRPLAVDP